MGEVIDLQEWRRRHPVGAAQARELSQPWRATQLLWVEPLLLSSLIVWRAAAVIWAGTVLAASSQAGFAPAGQGPRSGRRLLPVRAPAVRTIWIVRWRGLEETCTSLPEALDRRDQLDARGIPAELFQVAGGQRRKIG